MKEILQFLKETNCEISGKSFCGEKFLRHSQRGCPADNSLTSCGGHQDPTI